MTVDLSEYKVPVFPNINDAPVAPIASKAGNGADLIARLNGLIDTLAAVVSGSNVVTNWTAKLPAATNYASIEVYHTNISSYQLHGHTGSDNPLSLYTFQDFVKSYRLGTDVAPNEIINISEIINKCGVGYYFFLFKNNDNTLKVNSVAFIENPAVKGVSSLSPAIKLAVYDQQYAGSNTIYMSPLRITQIIDEAQITLLDELIIG